MFSSFRKTRKYRILVLMLLGICIISIYFLIVDRNPSIIPFGDSVQYWSAGRLMLQGENPYSIEKVTELRRTIGNNLKFPPASMSMMLYPPWVLPILLPFGIVNYPLMRIVWFIFHIVVLVMCANSIWKLYDGPSKKKYLIYLILLTFPPTYYVLVVGHFTTLILLGLVGFLFFGGKQPHTRRNQILAGASASLVLLKPQLAYLFLFVLLLWAIREKYWYILVGGLSSIGIFLLVSTAINPQILTQYWGVISIYDPGPWLTPTIGMGLRLLVGMKYTWLQLLPVIFGIGWFIYYWSRKRSDWNWLDELPLILLISLVTVPYGWTYDMVILLLPVYVITIHIMEIEFTWKVGLFLLSYLIVNIATMYLHSFLHDLWFMWYAPFLLIWYLIGQNIFRKFTKS